MFIATTLLVALIAGSTTPADEPLLHGMGPHHWKVSTSSKEAQAYFDQGLSLMYGFNHGEAVRSFRQATKIDPGFAMAYWGIATADGPNINNPMVDGDHAKEAREALSRATALKSKVTATERELIDAATKRYADPYPEDHSGLDKAYADAMRQVWRNHSTNTDVGALFAESMMDLRPWDLWTHEGAPQPGTEEILATLHAVLKLDPRHPQGLHLLIHSLEASPHPEKAVDAANKLRNLMPGLGHMVHMPSHIYIRVGRWKDGVIANEKAIVVDEAYHKMRSNPGFYAGYMAHNRHMLAYAAMMRGQSKLAVNSIDQMVGRIPTAFAKEYAPFVDGFFCMPTAIRKRFGLWDEVLKVKEPDEIFPIARTMWHGDRAIAYAAKGSLDDAHREQALFAAGRKGLSADAFFGNNGASALMDVEEHLMNGEVLFQGGSLDEGIAELRQAVRAEDALRYDEPPDWIQPIRHTLGAALVNTGHYAEAEAVYREDLKKLPNNGWSLYGLSRALQGEGKKDEAAKVKKQFDKVWKDADMSITSSCLCIKG